MKFKTEISAGGIVYKKLGSSHFAKASRDKKVLNLKSNIVWLITQHSKHKGWGFPKGLIGDKDSSEKIEVAALREVEEEGGVKAKIVSAKPIEVKYKYRFSSFAKASKDKKDYLVDKTVYYFLMEYISGDPKNHDWEMMDAKFAPVDEVKKTLFFKSDKEAFTKALILLNQKK